MREIIGENLNNIFIIQGINPKETFSGSIGYWSNFKVWEVNDVEFESLCNITDEQFEKWFEEGAWWRYASGSIMGTPCYDFIINGQPIVAWREHHSENRHQEDWNSMSEDEKSEYTDFNDYCDTWTTTEYKDILEYFCEELGASTERNVCALAADLAKYNNITIAELFRKYGGSYGNN
jgi:hypothetical protein